MALPPADVMSGILDELESFEALVRDLDDIRAALGLPSIEGPGLGAALSHVTRELHLRGWPQALEFVMVATGRADPASLTLDRSVDIYG